MKYTSSIVPQLSKPMSSIEQGAIPSLARRICMLKGRLTAIPSIWISLLSYLKARSSRKDTHLLFISQCDWPFHNLGLIFFVFLRIRSENCGSYCWAPSAISNSINLSLGAPRFSSGTQTVFWQFLLPESYELNQSLYFDFIDSVLGVFNSICRLSILASSRRYCSVFLVFSIASPVVFADPFLSTLLNIYITAMTSPVMFSGTILSELLNIPLRLVLSSISLF